MNLAIWDAIVKNGINSAIHCPTKKLADEVLKVVKEMSGMSFIDGRDNHWACYEEDTCYYPNIGDSTRNYMQYSDLKWAKENGQVIFEAADLLRDEDITICKSGVDIKYLLGME